MMATEAPTGLIARCIAACARHPGLTLLFALVAGFFGLRAMQDVSLDAVPDLSDTQVVVMTDWSGRSPDLVEDQITWPLSSALLSAPHVRAVRGSSRFGNSLVTVIFEDGTDLYDARSRVLEQLTQVAGNLPDGATPVLGPDATGVGWVYQYALVDRTGQNDLQSLRALQDWNLRLSLQAVPGVSEVATIGGFIREYQVHLDPDRLLAHGISVTDVARALRAANADSGGQSIEIAGHEHMVRGRGYLHGVADIEAVPVGLGADGAPITVGELAWVGTGPAPRQGFAELDGEGEVVGGVIVMRHGEDAQAVIARVKARIEELRPGLPPGVELVTTYDRSDLIGRAVATLRDTLIEEMVVVALVIFFFLMHARSALVAVIALPIAVLLSFLPLQALGLSANIMSLGGIAVAIGAMVDASIILVENVHKGLEDWEEKGRPGSRRDALIRAMQEVGPTIFFSLLVLTVSFLPVFSLQAVEGRLFRPLATTKTFSMAFAALLAVTLTPALVVLLVRGKVRKEEENPINRWLVALYAPVVHRVVRFRGLVLGLAMLVMLATIPAALTLEGEFMPPLNEGSLLFMPTAPPGMGATEAGNAMQVMDRAIRAVPEVERVFGKMGRADSATDPAPMGMAETTVLLKPPEEWAEGRSWDAILADLDAAVQVPGMPNLWWMPVQTRTEMQTTGVRSPVAVQVQGDNIEEIEAAAVRIEALAAGLPGTRSASAERSTGGFYLDIDIDRAAAARHGLNIDDINAVIEAAVGGMPVTELLEGRARFPVSVRYARDLREDPDAIGQILLPTATGAQVPLRQVAQVVTRTGPPMILSEGGRLAGYVFLDPGKVSLTHYVESLKEAVSTLDLPGVTLRYVGQFEHLTRANARLLTVVPLTLGLVVLLLWMNTGSVPETAMVLLAVPFSLVGAVWLLVALQYKVSVAVWVGLIALAGLDAETAVVMLLYLNMAWDKRLAQGPAPRFADLEQAVVDGAARRIRPKLMLVLTTGIGLLPVMWSTGTGADLMKRVAAPMVGGLATSFLLELLVYPALFAVWKGRGLPR